MNPVALVVFALVITAWAPQERPPEPLEALIQQAMAHNPRLAAAEARVRAAQARVAPAGALPDPVLSLGLNNFPVWDPGFGEPMTMKTVGVSQRLTYAGKRSLAVEAATWGASEAAAALDDLRLEVTAEVRKAYFELAFLDQASDVVARHVEVLSSLVLTSDARYGVGASGQEDVLHAQAEVSALASQAAMLVERRHAVLAGLNQLLDRPVDAPVDGPAIGERVVSAVARRPEDVRFVSFDLGARAADSPLPPLEVLLESAEARSPTISLHRSGIEAQRARVDLARRAHLPDFDVALTYGQRGGRPDMVGLSVAMPIPVNRGARQGAWISEAEEELVALRAEHRDHVNGLRARVAAVYADLERDRTHLALLSAGMLPQGAAALSAATAGYQVSRTDFTTVLANQATLFQYETSFQRTLADFAKNLAELERWVGEEILR